jgi:iron complex transport system substrate-binding protein
LAKFFVITVSLLAFAASFSIRQRWFPPANLASATPGDYRRIVSLAPSITETLFALGLGDRVVGVTRYCKYPPQVKDIAKVGGYMDPNFEAIIALKPDLVILLEEHEQSLGGFGKLGLKTITVRHKTVAGVIDSLRTIAAVCQADSQGRAIADDMQSRLDRIRKKTANANRPRIMIAVDRFRGGGNLADVYIAGKDDYFDKMIDLAGGANVYRQGGIRFPVVSIEGIMRLNPQVIVDLASGLGDKPDEADIAADDWRGLTGVEAVKHNRIYAISRDYSLVPGPRFIKFVEDLAKLLHPELDWNDP